jgi:hypothetical protein
VRLFIFQIRKNYIIVHDVFFMESLSITLSINFNVTNIYPITVKCLS